MFGFKNHPRGLRTLFFTEMWERFSFYGMRGILILFLTALVQNGGLGLNDKTAAAIYGLYTASIYLASLPGGWVADRLIGARNAVFLGGILIVIGQFTLIFPSIQTFFLGLLFVVMGTGLLKPNISVMVGLLYPEGGVKQDSGFTIFYMGINVGAAIGSVLVGYLGENINWHLGFSAAGVGMILGLIQFKLTGHYLGDIGKLDKKSQPDRIDENRMSKKRDWSILGVGLFLLFAGVCLLMTGVISLEPVLLAEKAALLILGLALLFFLYAFFLAGLTTVEKKRVGVIALLFVASAMFFSGFEQAGSSLNIFAERYTCRDLSGLAGILPATWLSYLNPVPASWFQSLNPVFIVVLAPMVASAWPALAKYNCNPPLIIKFAIGLLLLALGFLVIAAGARMVGDQGQVWPTWLISTYLIHTLGELCLSPVGLSTVSKLSPKKLVGQMMGIWFLSSALGNLIAGLIAGNIHEAEVAQPPVAIVEFVDVQTLEPAVDREIVLGGDVAEMEQSRTLQEGRESQGMLISRQFMRIVWFALGVAGLLFILSGRVRKITEEIE
ncbi:MAG: peptide MFS transporter [Limisphaerales bacterium]|jgi:POT family proton-dependent oligopeptide transporter|nr:peptide MFS transporter [Verrucomicrobiota bacterium]